MSGSLVPSAASAELPQPVDLSAPSWGPPSAAAGGGGVNIGRYFSALKRYKWLILATVTAGTLVGFGVSRFIAPNFEVNSTIWITDKPANKGPITAPQVMDAQAWQELLTSFAILDPVVGQLGLYLEPKDESDSLVFRGFQPTASLVPGSYTLKVEAAGRRWALSSTGEEGGVERVIERGVVGDSIGRGVGFEWAPPAKALGRNRTISFLVTTPR